jgi:hypothetical protein
MINPFDEHAEYIYFGHNNPRDHALCPHCGKQGNKIDEGDILWNERPKATDHDYECATCKGEWIIRRYRDSLFAQYPSAPYSCIYIPTPISTEARFQSIAARAMHGDGE